MRFHRSVPLAFLGLATVFMPGSVSAQAFQQLQQTCQQDHANCNVNMPDVPTPTPVPSDSGTGNQQGQTAKRLIKPVPVQPTFGQQLAVGMASSLLEGLFSGLLGDSEPAGPSPEEIAAQERQRVAEFQARAQLVSQQRATRDSQQASNMEDLAAQMSGGFDRPVDVSSGGSDPVHLQGTTPALFAPPSNPLVTPPPPPTHAAERLAKLAAENADVATLTKRLSDLSTELDAAKKEADLIGRKSQRRTEEYQAMEQTVAKGVSDAWDRALSLAFDGLFTANSKAVEKLSEVQANGRAWRELKSMLEDAQEGAEFLKDSSEKVDQFSEDVAFATRQRDFKEDVAWLGERLGGKYTELGKSILASAKTVRDELAILHRQGELQGFEGPYQAGLHRVKDHMDPLIGDVAKVRHELSLRTGIPENEIALPAPPLPPGSFGTAPPPVPAE